ncbi:lamin tail domain-containing protein [Fictibacillus fluitans]|uniref:Lamin tail domain-containing protein n=1 Tax=Fictibacillus fluitans TaxID=3058422 RepID=A0ABT8HQR7_9BACL|nr:lamin tail domain-containing protein [Fictibacillus sp. NE201]MDN4523102.1 lamin tail domain-containing protein [Fictibacillus sp. NE201]
MKTGISKCNVFNRMAPGTNFQAILIGVGPLPAGFQFIAFDPKKGCLTVSTSGGAIVVLETGDLGGVYLPPGNVPTGVLITNLNLGQRGVEDQLEYVQIQNFGIAPVDMTGWTIRSTRGGQVFTFPAGYILQPGATVYVTSGALAIDDPPTYLKWTTANVWNNNGDAAVLYNAQGQLISEFTAPPLPPL